MNQRRVPLQSAAFKVSWCCPRTHKNNGSGTQICRRFGETMGRNDSTGGERGACWIRQRPPDMMGLTRNASLVILRLVKLWWPTGHANEHFTRGIWTRGVTEQKPNRTKCTMHITEKGGGGGGLHIAGGFKNRFLHCTCPVVGIKCYTKANLNRMKEGRLAARNCPVCCSHLEYIASSHCLAGCLTIQVTLACLTWQLKWPCQTGSLTQFMWQLNALLLLYFCAQRRLTSHEAVQ